MFPQFLHVALQLVDAAGNGAAILLQLRFAGAARSYSAPLAREAQAAAHEPG